MHIPENYLSPSTCAVMAAAMVSVWTYSVKKVKEEIPKVKMPLLGIGAAFSFLGMMFNIPLPGGTTGHAVGGTLIAILTGSPSAGCIAVTIALLIQALLFGDGGILAFGANCFNMAFILPFLGFAIYKLIWEKKGKRKLAAGIGSYIGINAAAFCAAIEFGIQPLLFTDAAGKALYCPYPLTISIPAMMIGHLTLFGIAEIVLTTAILAFVEKISPETLEEKPAQSAFKPLYILMAVLIIFTPLGLLASGTAWGEWGVEEMASLVSNGKALGYTPAGMEKGFSLASLFPDYSMAGMPEWIGYILSAVVGVAIIVIFFKLLAGSKKDKIEHGKIAKLFTYVGLKRTEVESVQAGDIVCLSGIPDINIGDTICDSNNPEKIDFVDIDEPTVSMTFSVNNGPFAGREGQFVTSRHIRDRLFKELERNVSLRVKETESADSFEVCGRGELHLSVLIETMRREGFELLVSRPKVIIKEIDGVKCEPIERLVVNVPDDCIGNVIEKLGRRKAEMINMEPAEVGHTKVEFKIPARGLIGYRTEFLTDTKGEGTMNSIFDSYEPYKGEVQSRTRGVLVAFEQGTSITYGLYNAQERGELFIGPGVEVYEGMIVGINSRNEDISINVCKEKHLTNTRASGSDDALRLVPPIQLSLEKAIEFIAEDELVEVTPKNIRLRKKILDSKERERAARNANK